MGLGLKQGPLFIKPVQDQIQLKPIKLNQALSNRFDEGSMLGLIQAQSGLEIFHSLEPQSRFQINRELAFIQSGLFQLFSILLISIQESDPEKNSRIIVFPTKSCSIRSKLLLTDALKSLLAAKDNSSKSLSLGEERATFQIECPPES